MLGCGDREDWRRPRSHTGEIRESISEVVTSRQAPREGEGAGHVQMREVEVREECSGQREQHV